ncbi:polysaccharide lyase 6 family protein [Janthinobacterium fluminis]|uniref:Polysaccharide lyase 6 family protein n=1 Tax=Janthinobacterium fluminis TaxID=2987524 RepID=A0ABT5K109_9BURK|nr:polysaccharide lyase 6 family protein [Janthinobacterium fluminis]MDC8758549.1 polysaccharide lyase 6 family protein [Janthinobacterium fluminis]
MKSPLIGSFASLLLLSACGGGESAAPAAPNAALASVTVAALAADVVRVTSAQQLQTAINGAVPGLQIVLADGSYAGPFAVVDKNGKADAPITIRAEHPGRASIVGSGGLALTRSSYLTIQGLKFSNTASALSLSASHHVRITRNRFALASNGTPSKWIVLTGAGSHYNQIDHNEFGPRHDLGQMISIDGAGDKVAQHTTVEDNYFHDAEAQASNGGETVRIGLSQMSMSEGHTIVQRNLFVNCDSDAEVVSVKSKSNFVRYNTFINNAGQVSARHGHANNFYGNFFLGNGSKPKVGGLRIYGNDHRIYNNYMEGLTDRPIYLDGGDYDGGPNQTNPPKDELASHWRVYRAQVMFNTIVNSNAGIVIGGREFQPRDSRVANNIVVNRRGTLYDEREKTNTVFEGNIGYGSTVGGPRDAAAIAVVDPKLHGIGGLQKLSSASPARGAAVGSYAMVTEDMDGQPRSARDSGADEYSDGPVLRRPLTPADVGPDAP